MATYTIHLTQLPIRYTIASAYLRYDEATNELVCDKLGIAYPVVSEAVPNLTPQDGRLLRSRGAQVTE